MTQQNTPDPENPNPGNPPAKDDIPHESQNLAMMSDFDLDDGQEDSRMGGSLWLDEGGNPRLFIDKPSESASLAMSIAGWTHIGVRNPQYDVLRTIAVWTSSDQVGRADNENEPTFPEPDGANDGADQVRRDADEPISSKSTPRTNRRINLSDKAGLGLAPIEDKSVTLIDQIVDPGNIRRGYARMRGKDETELPASLKRMSSLERQGAQLNNAAVTSLISFNPAIRKQFRMHFDKQGRLFKKHFPLLQQTKRVGTEDVPIFDLDTKMSNCRDYAKTAAFVNQPSLVTSGGDVRKRKPKRIPDLRDDKGVYVKRQKPNPQPTADEVKKGGDTSSVTPPASEGTLVKVILDTFEKLEALRRCTGKKELKTKHEFIRQIAELRNESNLAIQAITKERAKVYRKNIKLNDKNNRLRNLVHKMRTEIDLLREDAGLSPSDLPTVSDDSDQEQPKARVKARGKNKGHQDQGESSDEDEDDS